MTDQTFGPGAAKLAGKTGLLLGWRPGDFWSATPEELRSALMALSPGGDDAPLDSETLAALIAQEKGKASDG